MGLCILEPRGLANTTDAPDTAFLEEDKDVVHDAWSKHAPDDPGLVLVPTPSDDPMDPLNWSSIKKETCFATLIFGTILAGTCGPLLSPAFVELVTILNEPIGKVAQLAGSLVLTIGVGSWWFAVIQQKFGTRPAFLLASLLQLVSMLWAGGSGANYPSLLASRVVQGISMGCYFNCVPSAINHIFFVHQRGKRMAVWNIALVGGVNIGPVISAQIIQRQDFTFVFWWQGLAAGLLFLMTIAFVPEMYYDRSYYEAEIDARRQRAGSFDTEKEKDEMAATAVIAPATVDIHHSQSKWAAYKPFSGSKSNQSIFIILFRPFLHVTSPAVVWGALTFSVVFNLLPMVSVIYSQLFSAPPYNFSTGAVGIISGIPPLIGTLIGTVLSGPLSDFSVKALAKRNSGVYEPEFRLIPMIPFCVLSGIGLFGWGLQTSSSWVVPAIFIAIFHIGVSAGTISCIGYVSDCARGTAAEAVALVVLVKSLIGFLIILWINAWLAKVGTRMFMISLGSLAVAISSLSLLAWVFGKRARTWYAKTKIGQLSA
ncbi:uncharacterized protein JCM15063_000045 [Sporobolomyces koalae]|uniref:uncharacterized protein n=1 Tax=Sporobolomyces koalae TaxID=500713 RepID=UPI00317E26C4